MTDTVPDRPGWYRLAKRVSPARNAVRWSRDLWGDLRLLLLTTVGYVPFHFVRNFFYRRAGVRLPRTSSIHWRARFFRPEGLVVGDHCTLGNDGFYDARDGITIGDNVNIAGDVRIFTRQHDIDAPDFGECGGPVVIATYAALGSRVTILPGVTIGEGAVVGSGAVVAKDVAPYTLVGGVPAKYIRDRAKNLDYKLGYAKRFQ